MSTTRFMHLGGALVMIGICLGGGILDVVQHVPGRLLGGARFEKGAWNLVVSMTV